MKASKYQISLQSVVLALVFWGNASGQADVSSSNSAVAATDDQVATGNVVDKLKAWIASHADSAGDIQSQPFASVALTREESAECQQLLVDFHRKKLMSERESEFKSRLITIDDRELKFFHKVFGTPGDSGRRLFISMHGGGGAPERVNDRQWENQKRLYEPLEGVYVAPRAPTNTWNLWHEGHIDDLFDRLIEDMVLFENVDPNRVYVMGYSAGGDGVYQLAPRMADRWAAASMMAGHPNDADPLNLRNIGFALYIGGLDAAYNRNGVAAEWKEKLAALQADDPEAYKHIVTIYPDKGHWMDGEDASALPWMSEFQRQRYPAKIVWKQDDILQSRFYNLFVDSENRKPGSLVTVKRQGQEFQIENHQGIRSLSIRANDDFLDLDQAITVRFDSQKMTVQPKRSIGMLDRSLSERFDPSCVFATEFEVNFEESESEKDD